MRFTLLTIYLLICAVAAWAQLPLLTFREVYYTPGMVKINDAKSCRFVIENTGDEPLYIDTFICHLSIRNATLRVSPGHAVLKPGDTTVFSAVWNGNEFGNFSAGIYPVSNAANSNTDYMDKRYKNLLEIQGYLVPDTPVHGPMIYFPEGMSRNFGKVQNGPEVTVTYRFKNIGDQPLVIRNMGSSSGSLAPRWSKEPVLPGKRGEVKLIYNTKDRPGPCTKSGYLQCNDAFSSNRSIVLSITGEVEPEPHKSTPEQQTILR
ncbi:DUF1573 domain-containing protein [Chitinophagaceae bacterium MMS25-I14]